MSEHAIREYLKTIGNGGGGAQQETDPVFTASPAHGISAQDILDWNDKQDELVSGTNIKTINWQSLLGSGDLPVAPPVTSTDVPTADTISEFDSDAHMNSTDMTTGSGSELEDFIDGLGVSGGGLLDIIADLTYDSGVKSAYLNYCKCRRIGHVVHVWGESSNGWSITQGGYRAMTTLEAEFRPPQIVRFVCGALGGTQQITGYVDTDGIVYLYTTSTTAYWNFSVTYLVP